MNYQGHLNDGISMQQHSACTETYNLAAKRESVQPNPNEALVYALQQIAGSYPKTDEGDVLAAIARDALREWGDPT
jgi:hypothetical protein